MTSEETNNEENRMMYVACCLQKFDFTIVGSELPAEYKGPAIGYLPVYKTKKEAEKNHPGVTVVAIQTV